MSCNCQALLEASRNLTGCQCSGPGYCRILKCELNQHGFERCRGDIRYHELWTKRGGAPCVGLGEASPAAIVFGLGDLVAWMIRVVTFGRVRPCAGCKSRIAWLNSKLTLWRWRRRTGARQTQ